MLTNFVSISVNAIAAPKFAAAYKNHDLVSIEKTAINSSKLMTLIALPLIFLMLLLLAIN